MALDTPHFSAPEGEFSADYRSYNGLIGLGSGAWTMWSRWSAAVNGSIHVYTDAGTQVAVARGAEQIEAVTPEIFEAADFTSSTRTPRIGEIVLLKNNQGFAAALQILNATVAAESRDGAEVRARYKILTGGGRNFSTKTPPEIAALNAAIGEALVAFKALEDEPDLGNEAFGIGHNHPPEAERLTKADYEAVAEALRDALTHEPDEGSLRSLADILAAASAKITEAVAWRYRLVQEGFWRQFGAAGALVVMGWGAWVLFHGTVIGASVAIAAVGARLFGWQ